MYVQVDGVPTSEPWDFDIGIRVWDKGSLHHIHITKPGDSIPFYTMYQGDYGWWVFDSTPSDFPSLAALRDLYPEGTYKFEFRASDETLLRTILLDYSGLTLPTSTVNFNKYPSTNGQTDISINTTLTWTAATAGNALLVTVEDVLTEDAVFQSSPLPFTTGHCNPGPLEFSHDYLLEIPVMNIKNWAGLGWPAMTVDGDTFACDLRMDNRNLISFTTIPAPSLSGWVWKERVSDFGYSLDEDDLVYLLSFGPIWYYNINTSQWIEGGPVGWFYIDWPFFYMLDTSNLIYVLPPVDGLLIYHFSTGQWEELPRITPWLMDSYHK